MLMAIEYHSLSAMLQTKRLLIGSGVLDQSVELFREQFGNSGAVIVADGNTYDAAGRAVYHDFHRARAPIDRLIFFDQHLYAEHSFVEQLENSLRRHNAIPIAVGSGTINDLTKLAAHRTNRPYMCIATAASMDGYTAFGASITHHGSKQTFDCPAPRAVLADLDVIASAPEGMNAFGYADLLAKITAGADWIIADELGVEPIDPRAWEIVQKPLRGWIDNPAGVRRGDRDALKNLLDGLMMSGYAMQQTKTSRPASGAEHQFSHLWDMEHHTHNGVAPAHGSKVGVAAVAVATLYEKLMELPLDSVVDSLVARWPDLDESLRRIDGLFDIPELAEKARLETRAKHISRDELREQLKLLQQRWPSLKMRLNQQLISGQELAQMLAEAGAPNDPGQIGISAERMKQSFHKAQAIRRRFTVLDLALRIGIL